MDLSCNPLGDLGCLYTLCNSLSISNLHCPGLDNAFIIVKLFIGNHWVTPNSYNQFVPNPNLFTHLNRDFLTEAFTLRLDFLVEFQIHRYSDPK